MSASHEKSLAKREKQRLAAFKLNVAALLQFFVPDAPLSLIMSTLDIIDAKGSSLALDDLEELGIMLCEGETAHAALLQTYQEDDEDEDKKRKS